MPQMCWMAFLATAVFGFGYFLFAKRQFDFLAVACVGSIFYFAPLFWGRVLQSSPDLPSTIQPAVYLIATAYVLGLVLAGVLVQQFERDDAKMDRAPQALSGYYAILAVVGLAGSLVSSHGAIISANKVEALKEVGYFYTLFEFAASLACISAVMERRWWMVGGGALLLSIDLLVGFRPFVVLTSLSVTLVLLMRDGRVRLCSKAPTYGAAAVALLVVMLLVHSARFTIFDEVAVLRGVPAAERVSKTSQMRSDTIAFALPQLPLSSAVPQVLMKLFEQSEPFIIQATLVGIVHTGLSCTASNIFKSVFLFAPPGTSSVLHNSYPATFYDEYQPILYPNITYGTGGNIWAEMLCRFGYAGVAIFGLLLMLTLVGFHKLLLKGPRALVAPVAFGGCVIAFYIHRNDLHYTLVMLRETGFVSAAAFGLSFVDGKIRSFLPIKRKLVPSSDIPERATEHQSKVGL